jgi:PAS domain S-box-containing protein
VNMTDEKNTDKNEHLTREEELYHTPKEARVVIRALRRQRRNQPSPNRLLFWGLMLILWAVLIFLLGQKVLTPGSLWKAFIVGLGAILIIQSVSYILNPSYHYFVVGRLIPGVILVMAGLGFLVGFNVWWPFILILAGISVILISWFLQREIQKRRVTQETLHESEIKYRHIIDNANSIIMEIDVEGKISFANKFALNFFGFQEDEILGHNVIGTILASAASASDDLRKMINDISLHPENYLHDETENLLKNGEKAWIIWTYKPIFDDGNNLKEILCIGIDITQHKKVEEMEARQFKERTAIEERTRLARDLHDAVSQTLFSTSLIAEVLPRVFEKNKEEGFKKLDDIRQLTRGALAEMRTLLFELRPAALADAELGDLLRQLAESVTGKARMPVTLKIKGTCEITSDIKVAFYRITQESLNNIVKHSEATQAGIVLTCQPGQVILQIADNGKGFDISAVSPGSFGLGNLKERAEQIGASLKIESKLNEGTGITVIWPGSTGEAS